MPKNAKEEIVETAIKKAIKPSTKTTKSKPANTTTKATKSKATSSRKKDSQKKEVKKATKSSKDIKKKTTKKTTPTKSKVAKKSTIVTTSKKEKAIEALPTVLEYYDLPYRYNETIVKVLAQTPNTLFIYWDISDKDRENYCKQYGKDFFTKTKPVLIIHNETFHYTFEVAIHDFANSWYLTIKDAKSTYRIELGRRTIALEEISPSEDQYIFIASSNQMESPNDHILFEKNQSMLYFKNVKTKETTKKDAANLTFIQNMGKIYNIYDLYQKIYQEELEHYDLKNPSSGNPTSTFK